MAKILLAKDSEVDLPLFVCPPNRGGQCASGLEVASG